MMGEVFYSIYYLSTSFVHSTVTGTLEYTVMQIVREKIMKANNKRRKPWRRIKTKQGVIQMHTLGKYTDPSGSSSHVQPHTYMCDAPEEASQ